MNEGVRAGTASAVVDDGLVHDGTTHGTSTYDAPSAADFRHARTLPVDEGWYKRAVFYEVLVRAFAHSNREGFGDLRGLTDKLAYLAWLGVDCLWLPPFYDSP